ncbi:fatty acid desaturase [Oxynema aestuarii]|jgi:omega-6 fatty acid desaturase (delta-12 desaturase)|uniref:Fatty acid desaturase n=1 Tax=Oxynema aestuarii AP17 TaxID=2064643 RepID=A0A6H1U2C8_9CYAN|nr:fatty acid desaturase [Oxynema aestuarii]QIZ72527.1 fatty acid desaturase [Oxynema aestuarii AP17]RMH76541.1 MAG: fatty acid desaturase [Cyanobacteria bacterium J007]
MTASTLQKSQDLTSTSLKEDLRLRDILQTLPKEIFIKNRRKAWTKVFVSVLMVGLGYWGLAIAPWYLLPLMWIFTGTALTGFFVIGHDCGHRSFANRKWVNDLVGHVMMLPLIFPFHGWRIGHNHHHKHTNKIGEDNAWEPWEQEGYDNRSAGIRFFYRRLRGRFWWIGSVTHWAFLHFDWWRFEGKQREQVRFSALLVIVSAAIAFPVMFATLGVWGFVKFWLLPWLVYHFWMSTFTIVHHTTPDIAFATPDRWNEAKAQLCGTVHCDYPRWVEFLCHDINVHVPHHLSTAIPSYNLRKAHQVLREKWGDSLKESRFSWKLMKEITDVCHLYDPERGYISFKEYHARQ